MSENCLRGSHLHSPPRRPTSTRRRAPQTPLATCTRASHATKRAAPVWLHNYARRSPASSHQRQVTGLDQDCRSRLTVLARSPRHKRVKPPGLVEAGLSRQLELVGVDVMVVVGFVLDWRDAPRA